jgi:hypothetical protein
MAFNRSWNENDPDGDVITISLLDDSQRDIKVAVRERLEGDSSDPYSGIFENGSFANSARIRQGTARAHVTTDANIASLPKIDGAIGISSDGKRIYHLASAGIIELEYLNRNGSRPAIGDIDLGSHNIKNLKAATTAGHAVEYSQAAIIDQQRTITNLWTFNRGTGAPFAVPSGSAKVANLDADKLDGHSSSEFVLANSIDTAQKVQGGVLANSASIGTSFATLNELNLAIGANETWVIKYVLDIITSNSYQVQLLGTSLASMMWQKEAATGISSTQINLTGNGANQILFISAVVSMGAASGTSLLQLRATSGSLAVTSNSHCSAIKVS